MIALLGELWATHRFCQPPVALPEGLARISAGARTQAKAAVSP